MQNPREPRLPAEQPLGRESSKSREQAAPQDAEQDQCTALSQGMNCIPSRVTHKLVISYHRRWGWNSLCSTSCSGNAAPRVGAAETKLGCRTKFSAKSLTGLIRASQLQRDVPVCQVFHLGLAKNHQPKAPKSQNLTIKALAPSKSNI